ncbi:hypothetical protein [Gulosibacter molinativorax]|uniref:DUF3450 domain-containing protein n=1 Tax=Gulosibacter molinativorax TaxID=256821 RepID=A0ABT7C9C9_9MICO|nr:hypothetical protein [Gulosibacter molinativorax]MDJ1371770.1 hypothetical protein [Gulosibacter molinativorax]QUY60860.1 Hypotetical protein [Gulosibacter molinativorax]
MAEIHNHSSVESVAEIAGAVRKLLERNTEIMTDLESERQRNERLDRAFDRKFVDCEEALEERDRARNTAVLLEQALADSEREVDKWKAIYNASNADQDDQRERILDLEGKISEYDDLLIKAELELEALRGKPSDAFKDIEFVSELTTLHLGALVMVDISDEVVVTDRIQFLESRRDAFGDIKIGIRFDRIGRAFELSADAAVKVVGEALEVESAPF